MRLTRTLVASLMAGGAVFAVTAAVQAIAGTALAAAAGGLFVVIAVPVAVTWINR